MKLDTLMQHLLQKMNANTKGIFFNAGYLSVTAGKTFEHITFPNYYTEVKTTYTPAIFTMVGDPQNVVGKDMINWSIIIELILTGEAETDEHLIAEVEALNEFRLGIVNNPNDIVDGYKLIMSANPIARSGSIKVRGGQDRLTVSMEMSVDSGIGIFSGNDIVYKLALLNDTPITIFPISASTINGTTEETETDLSEPSGVTKTILRDGTIRYDMSLIYDNSPLHIEIMKTLSGVSDAINKRWDYQEQWETVPIRKTMLISGGTISKNANNIIILNIQFVETNWYGWTKDNRRI